MHHSIFLIMYYTRIALLLFCTYLLASCQMPPPEVTPLDGTYRLSAPDGNTYDIQLVTADDGAVYGTLFYPGDSVRFDAPIDLKALTDDSLHLNMWYGRRFISVARRPVPMSGQANVEGDTIGVTLRKTNDSVSADLRASAKMIPLPLQAEAPAFAAHKSNGQMYVIGWAGNSIYLVEEIDTGWIEQPVPYDQERYSFSSIGLSPDEQTLVAHGGPREGGGQFEEGGAIYLLHLSNPTTIDSIELLPGTVNTPSYDNFADFTASGDLIFSSWGDAAGIPGPGKGDLYRATRTTDGWQTRLLPLPLNTADGDAGPSMNAEETVVLFHRNRRNPPMADKIFASRQVDGQWEEPIRLPAPINITHSGQYGPRLDPANEYLYWTSSHRGQGNMYRIRVADVPELAALFAK